MKTKESKISSSEKATKLKSLKVLSNEQLETIVGGPVTSRGTETGISH